MTQTLNINGFQPLEKDEIENTNGGLIGTTALVMGIAAATVTYVSACYKFGKYIGNKIFN